MPGARKSISRKSSKKEVNLSQVVNSSQGKTKLGDLVNNCVRYILHKGGNKWPIKRTDLLKHAVRGCGRSFSKVISETRKVLNNVYGYGLYVADESSSNKSYLIKNLLEPLNDNEETKDSEFSKIVIMLVLTHIFMSNAPVTEESIARFLNQLKIDMDENHDQFGNVRELVMTTMVKTKYLSVTIDKKNVTYYEWGSRAEEEVTKRKLLEFVCQMYKNRLPQSWKAQYENIKNAELFMEVDENEESDSN